jgi:REP element-mobilizing transposase RayT
MPRGLRIDWPGAHHHVYNRGIARRPVHETALDMRAFEDRLAEVVDDGLLLVHAYSLLTTHHHVLVESPVGELSEAMRRIGNGYVRRFNRERGRDGALMRGRFGSRLVNSATYFAAVVRYIDRNPVEARIADAPQLHPYGSAFHYSKDVRPSWLATTRVEALACDVTGDPAFRPETYVRFAADRRDPMRELVERRIASRPHGIDDPLDDLVRAAPIGVQRWMMQRSNLADGTSPGVVVLPPLSVTVAIREAGVADPPVRELTAGLLRGFCGSTINEIASALGCAPSTAARATCAHAAALRADAGYAALAARVVHLALRRAFDEPRRLFDLPRRLPESTVRLSYPFRGFVSADQSGRGGAVVDSALRP